jgi:hypothetical protein
MRLGTRAYDRPPMFGVLLGRMRKVLKTKGPWALNCAVLYRKVDNTKLTVLLPFADQKDATVTMLRTLAFQMGADVVHACIPVKADGTDPMWLLVEHSVGSEAYVECVGVSDDREKPGEKTLARVDIENVGLSRWSMLEGGAEGEVASLLHASSLPGHALRKAVREHRAARKRFTELESKAWSEGKYPCDPNRWWSSGARTAPYRKTAEALTGCVPVA